MQIPNYLWQNILATLFCCLPLGIVGIIKSTKVDTLVSIGNIEEAKRASEEAAKWLKYNLILGGVSVVLYIMFMVFGAIASS